VSNGKYWYYKRQSNRTRKMHAVLPLFQPLP